ncbi:MAG: PfkB family carbohydrate kinase [Candidatus Nanopelagicales bacterium]
MTEILCVGLTTIDITYRTPTVPSAGKKTQATSASLSFGGPAANAAATAAAMGLAVTLCSAVGNGPFADVAVAELAKAEVELLAARSAAQLPISAVTICDDGSRTVVSANGINELPAEPSTLVEVTRSCKVVLVDGHYPELALAALQSARAAGIPTVIDLGSWKDSLPMLLPYCSIAIASADFSVPGSSIYEYLFAAGIEFAAVTNGESEIVWRDAHGAAGHVCVPQVRAIDTNGAGDVLHGAFAAFLSRGAEAVTALEQAAVLASESCTRFGARIPAAAALHFGGRQQ